MIRQKRQISFAILMALLLLSGCASKDDCPVTEPAWALSPEDGAILNPPAYEYFFINEDQSIWASAWWVEPDIDYRLILEEGIKVGWFRPEGAELVITGKRLDAESPPLESHVPCCYPTRFQATGLYFPVEGCWEVNAKAADKELTFVVWLEPSK